MYKFAINRPVSIVMLFLSFIIFGAISLGLMNKNLFPGVEIPLIEITTFSNGDSSYIENRVTKEIENSVSSISGVKNVKSFSYDNVSVVLVEFELSKDIEVAANDVRDKLASLSLNVKPNIKKLDSNGGEVMSLFITPLGDMSEVEFMKLIDDDLRPFFQRIKGVGSVDEIGFRKPQIRIFADPFKLNKYSITAKNLSDIITMENFSAPLGQLKNSQNELFLKSNFDAKNLQEIESIRVLPGVFVSDIAEVKFSLSDYSGGTVLGEKNGVLLRIKNVPGQNSVKTANSVKESMREFDTLFGKSVGAQILYDKSKTIDLYISQTATDLVLGVLLTVFIVFVFLRNITSTIIAALAVPTSIFGTFCVMYALGYDLNRLTLVALTLGIGIFVDDAIVVIENITKKAHLGMNPLQASYEGIAQIAFSVLGISTVLLCVFVPMGFMSGIVGRYFNSFAISVACGIVVSFFVSIMLIPSLCARFLKTDESKFYKFSEPFFEWIEDIYEKQIKFVIKFKKSFIVATLVLLVGCISLISRVGIDFLPQDDSSEFNIFLQGDPSWSYEKTQSEALKILRDITSVKEVKFAYLMSGYTDAKEPYKAKIYVQLVPLKDRNLRQSAVMENLREKFTDSTLKIRFSVMPLVDLGGGENNQIEIVISGKDLIQLREIGARASEILSNIKGVVDVKASNSDIKNEIEVSLNKELIKRLGISPYEIAQSLNSSFNSNIISNLDSFGEQYEIVLGYGDEFKTNLNSVKNIQLRTQKGSFVTLDSIASFKTSPTQTVINRYNKEREVLITANTNGVALGMVKKEVDGQISQILKSGYTHTWTGFVEYMDDTVKAFGITTILSMILIYMVLASLYESFVQPLIIMITMPLAFGGVVLGLYVMNDSFSLYVMVATILLFGMVGKNAILVVDFANRLCAEGIGTDEAVIKAGKMRLRAILMTTFAMIFAMLPLAFSHGAGYEGNSPMAICVIFGLITSTALTLLVVPAMYDGVYKFDMKLKKLYERRI